MVIVSAIQLESKGFTSGWVNLPRAGSRNPLANLCMLRKDVAVSFCMLAAGVPMRGDERAVQPDGHPRRQRVELPHIRRGRPQAEVGFIQKSFIQIMEKWNSSNPKI